MKNYTKLYTNKLWNDLLAERFFEDTNLFYDFPTFGEDDKYKTCFPTPEQIKLSIPNPCGWGAGMEDGCIDGGTMLDAAIICYEQEGEPVMSDVAKRIFEGLKLCATVSSEEGFLARSVSPLDLKSHYIDSSRDQYTHWIYGVSRYYESEMISDEDKAFVQKAFCSFAKRAAENVTEANGWDYLREDGGHAAVNTMWGDKIEAHEQMRLPMIYLAAWKIGGDERYRDTYLSIRDKAFELSEKIDLESHAKLFTLNQMQQSWRFVYDYDGDADFKEKCYGLMARIADYCMKKSLELANALDTPFRKEQTTYTEKPWYKVRARYQGMIDGYAYYVPLDWRRQSIGDIRSRIKIIGDGAAAYTTFPDAKFNDELDKVLKRIICSEDEHISVLNEKKYAVSACHMLDRLKNAK